MTQMDKEALKRAAERVATGESLGAFVTMDINRLEKDELIMLGMREMLSKYLAIVNRGITNALPAGNGPLFRALSELETFLKADSDAITEQLTRSALRHKSAVLQEIPKVPM